MPFKITNISTSSEDFLDSGLIIVEATPGTNKIYIPITLNVDYYENVETFNLEFDSAAFCTLNVEFTVGLLFKILPKIISIKDDYSNSVPLFKLFYTSAENFYEDTSKGAINEPIKIQLTKLIKATNKYIPYRFYDYSFTLTLNIQTGKYSTAGNNIDATGNTDFNSLFIPITFPANTTEIDFDLEPYIVNDGTPKTLEFDEYFNISFSSILFPDNTNTYHGGVIDLSYTNSIDMKLLSPDIPLPPVVAVVDGAPNNSISILDGDSFKLDLTKSYPIENIATYEWKTESGNIIHSGGSTIVPVFLSFSNVDFIDNISAKFYYKVTGKDDSTDTGFITVYNNAHPEVWLDQSNERYGSLNTSMIFGGLGFDPEDGYIIDINWYILNDDGSKTEMGNGYEIFYSFPEAKTYNVVAKIVDTYFAETYEHITVIII